MSESSVVQCEEYKAVPEKNKGRHSRQFKSQEQLQGLEDFYNEHNYPSESQKAEISIKLNLTEKQVSSWFCHRRLKDKREVQLQALRRQEFSSGVIQDHASGLKQDSCSSTKQADFKRAYVREAESPRYCHENLPLVENYQQRSLGDGTDRDDTSSESNSAPQESFYPQKRSNLAVETTDFRASNGFISPCRGRGGPSGYLKIKYQTENAAITAVKRQLGRHYREDGPSLGIEFDPLPPGAFVSPSNINDDAYGVPDSFGLISPGISGIHRHPRLSPMTNESLYEAPEEQYFRRSDPDFSFSNPKHKLPFLNHGRGFPDRKPSFGIESYSSRGISDYNGSKHFSIQQRLDSQLDHHPHSYGEQIVSDSKGTFLHDYNNVYPKGVRQRGQFFSRSAAMSFRNKDPMYEEDQSPSNWDDDVYVEKRPSSKANDLIKLKMRPTNELRANKRGREEVLEEQYPIRTPSKDLGLWSKPIKRPAEVPLSFSENETAERSSSME